MDKIDLGWGNPYFLLEILDELYTQKLSFTNVLGMSYAPDTGIEALKNLIKRTINQTTGMDYKYVLVTTGTTQAINVLLRVLKDRAASGIVETNEYGYPYYNGMIEKAGYRREVIASTSQSYVDNFNDSNIKIIDSPSNPLGLQYNSNFGENNLTIWDAVYHNKIYTTDLFNKPNHVAMVNSYSKLLGLTGARIGYIATNDPLLYDQCCNDVLMENATISVPSQVLIMRILNSINLNNFMEKGRDGLNINREEFKNIEYLFGNQPVQDKGMFYCAEGDKKLCKLLDKCGITYIELDNNIIRLSMGQTNTITRQAVARILKSDKK